MSLPRIDFSHLAAFVAACDCVSMSQAADALELTTSALSARLHGLETRLGLKLFARHGRNMLPLPASVFLYNRSLRLLSAEEFLQRRTASATDGAIRSFGVQLDEAYTGTILAHAVLDAIRHVHSIQTACFIDLILSRRSPAEQHTDRAPLISTSSQSLEIAVRCTEGNSRARGASLLPADIWIRAGEAPSDIRTGKETLKDLLIPELPGTLSDDIAHYFSEIRPSYHIAAAAVGLQDYFGIARLLSSHDLLLPRALLPARVAASGPRVSAVPGAPACLIEVAESGDDSVVKAFLAELRRRLAAEDPSESRRPFRPAATMRQIGTLNLVLKTGSMRSAARAVGLTAPMIPAQIAQLEAALGTTLMVKGRGGSTPTGSAAELHPMCVGIEHCFNAAIRMSRKVAADFQQSIRIGLPPSWSSDSRTSECMAVALSAFHREYPECHIEVDEGPRDVLHGGIRSGRLNIAIVGRVALQVGSIAIGTSEDISLVVNRRAGFRPHSRRVSADELRRIPLILAPAHVTMHQTLIAALAKATVQLEPVMRLGSIPLIVSIIRRSPFGTILPASVVRKELEAGLVEAFPLDHIVPRRRLWAIFSTENPLSEMERHLIALIKNAFADALEDAKQPLAAAES